MSVPDDVYREARIRAAERGTSISALVSEFLRSLAADDAEVTRLAAQQRRIVSEIRGFSARDRLDRAALHDRAVR